MSIRHTSTALAGAIIATIALVPARAQTPASPDEAQIRTLVEATLPDRYNKADAGAIAALWSETATHGGLVRGARVRDGRANIEQMWVAGFSQPSRDRERRLSVAVTGIRFVRPDVAAVDAQNTYRGGQATDGSPKPDTGELMFLVLSRDNGAWTITASRVVPLPQG